MVPAPQASSVRVRSDILIRGFEDCGHAHVDDADRMLFGQSSDDLPKRRAGRAEFIDRMVEVGIAERDPANDDSIVAEAQMSAREIGVGGQRRLRRGGDCETLRGRHQVCGVDAAIDSRIGA